MVVSDASVFPGFPQLFFPIQVTSFLICIRGDRIKIAEKKVATTRCRTHRLATCSVLYKIYKCHPKKFLFSPVVLQQLSVLKQAFVYV